MRIYVCQVSSQNLRSCIITSILESCHFLETLYDPGFRWRSYLCGKPGPQQQQEVESPVRLHPETIPFLYESFETALGKYRNTLLSSLVHFGKNTRGKYFCLVKFFWGDCLSGVLLICLLSNVVFGFSVDIFSGKINSGDIIKGFYWLIFQIKYTTKNSFKCINNLLTLRWFSQ